MLTKKDENPAKLYLMEVEKLDIKINQKLIQLSDLKNNRFSVPAIDTSKEKVNCSISNNSNNLSDKLIDLENEINKDIDNFYDLKNIIINQIQKLDKKEYVDILHKRYIEYKEYPTLEHIAVTLGKNGKSWRQTVRIHGEALECFRKKFLINL